MKEKSEALNSIFSQREKFVLIGLTGRTGAGCTTVANILEKESMEELDLRSYKTCDYNNSDERKYSVVYRFMKEGKKWNGFTIIEASSIIFSYILESTYGELFLFLDQLNSKGKIKELDIIKKRIVEVLSNNKYKDPDTESDEIKKQIIDEFALNTDEKLDVKNYDSGKLDEVNKLKDIIKYYTVSIQEKKNLFREIMTNNLYEQNSNENDSEKQIYDLYSFFMQMIANNIRSSGKYNCSEEKPGKEIEVAHRINQLIKIINLYVEKGDGVKRVRICIDALRNSIEIQYFRERYRAFYAFAVNTENEDRQNRLELNKKELQSLDKIEYPDDNTVFYHQNIQACLEIADIYLYNPNVINHKYYELSEQILKYIALILHPGLIAPTHLERCMQLAFNAKYNSGCLSRQVGAVVTGDDFSVRSVGWNDVPKGQVPCNLRCVEDYCRNKDDATFSEFELSDVKFGEAMDLINTSITTKEIKSKKAGRCYAYCFKDIYCGITNQKNQVHTRALHAEENAFLQIAKYGGAEIRGGKLFTTASPCELCSKKAYQLGIKEIYYIDPYPGISKSHILTFGKTGNPKMILFQGAIGNAYISLFSPKMPYKDEIGLATGVSGKEKAKEVFEDHINDI